jgi:hypothetical protein
MMKGAWLYLTACNMYSNILQEPERQYIQMQMLKLRCLYGYALRSAALGLQKQGWVCKGWVHFSS